MTRMTSGDWRLIGIGVAAGALIFPVLRLFRILSFQVTPDIAKFEREDVVHGDNPVPRSGNIINICIMGVMATTRVNVSPRVRKHEQIKGEESSSAPE